MNVLISRALSFLFENWSNVRYCRTQINYEIIDKVT